MKNKRTTIICYKDITTKVNKERNKRKRNTKVLQREEIYSLQHARIDQSLI